MPVQPLAALLPAGLYRRAVLMTAVLLYACLEPKATQNDACKSSHGGVRMYGYRRSMLPVVKYCVYSIVMYIGNTSKC